MSTPIYSTVYHPTDAVFRGVPILLRLVTGEEIIATVYRKNDYYIVERPLLTAAVITIDTVSLKFVRWIPLSENVCYAIGGHHVVTIATLSPMLIPAYKKHADRLYALIAEVLPDGHSPSQEPPSKGPFTHFMWNDRVQEESLVN